ncbi:MBL fold metallo-hydrolase [Microvirga thermotolerans]|uniref:MBL fold metallo-hydrolase n=1 Tax=Microvirga thermotolerans TaxID=2651334 RepID=A0A5P9JTV4_9HYPH|nr:MBL fold metallo-hydrolase [Microvirga thermotolerans]QFU14890.1 MBL fold metallo-hydrolase [Microvirga thermotolerans]
MVRRAASSEPLQVRFWGTRGSTCASGARFVEFGGHTACVEVRCGDRLFIVDAGSGLSALGAELGADAPAEIDLLFSHLHLDHVCGLPFFKPALLGCNRVIRTYCGNMDGESAEGALARLYAPPLFPVTLEQLPARFEHCGFRAGETLTFPDGAKVATHLLNHPGGATGYRFEHGGRSACYISDLEHGDPWPDPGLLAFVRDADLIIYDGMFSESEYPSCRGWGHSTWEKGVALAKAANVASLAIFHLYPGHDDAFLKAAEAEMQKAMPSSFVARERQTVSFAPREGGAVAQPANPAKVPAV